MKEEILNNLSGLIEYVKQGADFVKEQAPLYVQELITYQIWLSVLYIVVCSLSIGFFCWLIKYFNAWLEKNEENIDEGAFFIYTVFILMIIVSILSMLYNIQNLVQVIVAPRVFIVEKLMSICQ